jgi:hypothetical protein
LSRPPGFRHSEETKARIRAAKLGAKHSDAAIDKMRAKARARDIRREKNPAWKGGIVMSRGRAIELQPDGSRKPRARRVLEQKLGRKLLPTEEAHHKNELKSDDSADNLEPLSKPGHARLHMQSRRRDKLGRIMSCDI